MQNIVLTRVVSFSSGHRYWFDHLSPDENLRLFGPWASRFNHGHNYVLSVSVSGPINPDDGMVVNIKDIDFVLKRSIVSLLDQKSINDEVPHFQTVAPCLENLLDWVADNLGGLPKGVRLAHIKLEETPTLFAEKDTAMSTKTVTRTYEFAASHRLHLESATHEANLELFGKCNNPAGHGHNYTLEVTVTGQPDPRTGFIVDISALDKAVEDQVLERYDHKNLNCDVPELQGMNPTSEVVAQAIFDRLKPAVPATLVRVRLHETARNVFEVSDN